MPPDTKWDAIESTAMRADEDFEFREVILYGFESVYDPDTGKYHDTMVEQARFNAEVRIPSVGRRLTGPDGTDVEADAEIFPPTDDLDAAGVELIETGGEEKASVFEDTLTGTEYVVSEAIDEDNGLIRCEVVER